MNQPNEAKQRERRDEIAGDARHFWKQEYWIVSGAGESRRSASGLVARGLRDAARQGLLRVNCA